MGKYVVKQAKTGYHFNLKAGNGEVIAVSEIYSSERGCLEGVESVKRSAPGAACEDQTLKDFAAEKNPKFEICLDRKGEFRFRLKSACGELLISSGGYRSKSGCRKGIGSVRRNADSETVSF